MASLVKGRSVLHAGLWRGQISLLRRVVDNCGDLNNRLWPFSILDIAYGMDAIITELLFNKVCVVEEKNGVGCAHMVLPAAMLVQGVVRLLPRRLVSVLRQCKSSYPNILASRI